jgi:hypothetical protein
LLCHWLASQEGFNIKWQHVFINYLNSLETSYKKTTKLKLQSKCGEKASRKNISPNFGIFSKEKNGNIVAECQLQYVLYNIISFGEFSHCGEIFVEILNLKKM